MVYTFLFFRYIVCVVKSFLEKTMIIRKSGSAHFTREFPCGAKSDRVILPTADGVGVKVVHLKALSGSEWVDTVYTVDETLIILSGKIRVTHGDEETVVSAGDCCLVPAGTVYTFTVLEKAEVWCVFSLAGPDGELVDDS